MSESDPIAEKIKKLLRLGRSSNPHEAELALQRAFELAEKHRIDVESLNLDEREAAVVHEWFEMGHRLSFIKKRALGLVQRFFHVEVCISSPRVVFVGRAQDITIAHYVFEFVVRAGTKCLRAFESGERAHRRKVNHGKRTQFLHGFFYGLSMKLRGAQQAHPLTDQQNALVVGERLSRESYLGQLIPNTKKLSLDAGRQNKGALLASVDAGQSTSIHQPLNTTPGAPLQLL